MQKPLTMIAVIAVASIGIGYGLGNCGSSIPPERTEQMYVVPVRTSDRSAEIRSRLEDANSSVVETRDAVDEAADAARWQWLENSCIEDLIRITAADDAFDSAEESLSKPQKMLLSELK